MSQREIDNYIKEWRELAKPIEELTGIQQIAFDPGVQFVYERKTVTLPRWLLELINAGLASLEAKLETGESKSKGIIQEG